MNKTRSERRKLRQRRVRARVQGTSDKPRLAVYKSNTAIYAQLIDDQKGVTIVACDSRKVKGDKLAEKAKETGKNVAKLALDKKIKEVVFDRGGFTYTGVVKALADSAREAGLKF
jgi:large subunit ribosomal protein L18